VRWDVLGVWVAALAFCLAAWALIGGTALIVWRVFLRPFGETIGAF
jgi:hypothetical protein